MLFSVLYKIMVNKATFVGFRRGICPNHTPWARPWYRVSMMINTVNTEKSQTLKQRTSHYCIHLSSNTNAGVGEK